MIRVLLLLVVALVLNSCSHNSKSKTEYIFITDHYSSDIENSVVDILSLNYSPCPNLARSTYQSKVIRYDLAENNTFKVFNKSLFDYLLFRDLNEKLYDKKLNKFNYPPQLKSDQNIQVSPKNLEYYLNSFDPLKTRVYGLNSIGIQYKNLKLKNTIQHFQLIFDLKDALSDYTCNDMGEKQVIILVNLFTKSNLDDCLIECEKLPMNPVCADDGKEYRNIQCLQCHNNLKEISCDQSAPLFRKEILTSEAFEIFYQFVEAQNLISNNKTSLIAEDLIDNTLRLFDPGKKVEILNLGTQKPKQFTTREYLSRLLTRPFDEIGIEWDTDWTVTQEWTDAGTEIPESEMMAEGEQYFVGYRKSLVAYSDAIKKNVHFHARLVETFDDNGNEVLEWKVFIGDITIASRPSELQ